MKLIRTEEARNGQKAAKDVTDLRGNLLFKAGTELTPELLTTCRNLHISHLFVEEGDGENPSSGDLTQKKEAVAKQVDVMFEGVDQNPPMAALREAAKRYLIAKIE